jgi:hypothetical protein
VAQGLDISELQVNPSLVTTDENALALRGLGGRNAGVVAVETNAGAGENNAGVERGQRPALGSLRGILAEALRMAQLRPRVFFAGRLKTYLSERMSALESVASEHFWVFYGRVGGTIGGGREKEKSVCWSEKVEAVRRTPITDQHDAIPRIPRDY